MDWETMLSQADGLLPQGSDLDAGEINEIKQYIQDCMEYEAEILPPGGGTPENPPPPPPLPPGRCEGLVQSRMAGTSAFIQDWINTVKNRIDEPG